MNKENIRKVSFLFLVLLFAAAIIGVANAHTLFIVTEDNPRVTPVTQEAKIFYGHPNMPESLTIEVLMEEARLYKPNGSIEKLELKEEFNHWTTTITLDQMGDYIIVVEREPSVYDPRIHNTSGPVKLSSVNAKALIRGRGLENWDRVIGQGAEIIPLVNPFYLRAGDVFKAKFLYDGIPVKGEYAAAHETRHLHDPEEAQTGETSEDGIFSINITKPGMWLITADSEISKPGTWKATYTRPGRYTEGEEYDYDIISYGASITVWAAPGIPTESEERISSLEENVAEIPMQPSTNLVYSALGVAIIALLIGLAAIVIKKK